MSSISIKTEWYDSDLGEVIMDESQLKLYNQLIAKIKPFIKRPVWVYNANGGPARPYRDLGYSDGAKAWLEQGGEVRQEGVANARFSFDEPTPRPI